jgi:hypothetical protein
MAWTGVSGFNRPKHRSDLQKKLLTAKSAKKNREGREGNRIFGQNCKSL